jgi:predicted nucleotidyltransferase
VPQALSDDGGYESGRRFRFCAQVSGFRPDVIEAQLAHSVRDGLGRAYNRTKGVEQRRKMLQAWTDYLVKLQRAAASRSPRCARTNPETALGGPALDHWTSSFHKMPILGIFMPNMGATNQVQLKRAGLADALFSGTRQRVLGLLFGQPSRSFYATELIGLARSGSGAVQRELAGLLQSGLITVKAIGNQKHYQANPESPIFAELCGIVQKTVGLAEPLKAALAPLALQIIAAFVYGSVAKRTDTASSDIDLLLLSDELSYGDAFGALEAASSALGRTVNPTILTRKEFAKRMKAKESFLTRVLEQPKVWIVGGEGDLAV